MRHGRVFFIKKLFFGCALLVFLLPGRGVPIAAAETAKAGASPLVSPSLSEEARRLMQRGIAAAEAKEWAVATPYFFEAQKIEPLNSKIIFNLGFSHLNAGQWVLADLWLRAYLALEPQAANAGQVLKEIERLNVSIDATAGKLIEEAMTQLQELPDAMTPAEKEAFQAPADPSALQGQTSVSDVGLQRQNALGAILFAQTASGRITEALNFAARMGLTQIEPDSLRRYFGQIQVDTGDFEAAVETLKGIQSPVEKDVLLNSLVMGEIAAEQLDKAEEHIRQISDPQKKVAVLDILVLKYVRQLEVEKAEEVLKSQALNPEDQLTLSVRLISGYLKKDNSAQARVIANKVLEATDGANAKQIDRVTIALAALGRGPEALALLQQTMAQSRRDERKILEALRLTIPALCWSDQLDLAVSMQAIFSGMKVREAQGELKKAQVFVAAEKGDYEKAEAVLREIPSDVRDALIVSLFWRFVHQGRLNYAARIAMVSESELVKARLFFRLADHVTGTEALFQKKALRDKGFQGALRAEDVVGLRQLAESSAQDGDSEGAKKAARAAAVLNWIELADYFSRIPATADLAKHVQSFKIKGFDRAPYETALAALEWGRVSIYIRAREKNPPG